MVTVKVNGIDCQVCTQWSDVDPIRVMVAETFKEELEVLTTIPKDILEKTEDIQLFPFKTLISFLEDEEVPELQALDVADSSYKNLSEAITRMRTGKPWRRALKAANVYYPHEKNPVRLLSLGISIINQITLFLENYTEMLESQPTAEEVNAGIEELNSFGYFGTALTLAGGDPLKVDAILNEKAIRIYEILRYNFRKAKYMEELHKIKFSTSTK